MQLIFVHGSGGTGQVWKYQLDAFPGAAAPTLPGHPTGQVISSVEGYARWLHDFIGQHGYQDAVVVGHSMGGAIAIQYVLDYPGELKAMALVGSGARIPIPPDPMKQLEAAIQGDTGPWLNRMKERTAGVTPTFRERFIQVQVGAGPASRLNDLRCCDRFDVMDRVGEISLPTLLLCGTDDDVTPVKYHQYLADRIPGARMVAIPGAAHYVFAEKPAEFNQALQDFLQAF